MTADTITIGEAQRIFELDLLAAVARGKPHEAVGFWMSLKAECEGLITRTLTDAGRERLEAFMAKLTPDQRAEFMAKGLKAEFLKGEATT